MRNERKKAGRTTRSKKAPVRDKIFRATVSLIRKGGPGAATARAICQKAGITAPTLYHYFGDIYGLYNDVLELMYIPEALAHPGREYTDPFGMIEYMWDCVVNPATTNPGLVELKNELVAAGRIPESMLKFYNRLEKAFEQLQLRQPLNFAADVSATMYWAAATGLALRIAAARHNGAVCPPPTAAASMKQLMMDAIIGPGTEQRTPLAAKRPATRRPARPKPAA